MAKIFTTDTVQYVCTCGTKRPITRIYFCRHCSKLRCSDCVSHEVDSHYCPNCLEYMPSPEARLKKNRCASCFDCPSCMHTLSIRATSIQVPSPEDPSKTLPKKVYYLACGFCRWTSRDVGLADQPSASGGWLEYENPHNKKISSLFEYYRIVVQKEKLDRERKKMSQRSGYIHFADRYGMSPSVSRKYAALNTSMSSYYKKSKEEDAKAAEEMSPSEGSEEAEPLPEDYLTQPVNIAKVCTITQRLMQPDFQPIETSQLFPRHKHLLIKRSQRCRECEHNLSKPEYNPSSIKFKIQLAAFHHIPEVKIKSIGQLKPKTESILELTICNPTPHVTHITFVPSENNIFGENAEVVLPTCEFVLPARDDTAEFDDTSDVVNYKDDPQRKLRVVTFRKSNKIGVKITVIPSASKRDNVKVAFQMKHDFTNMVVPLQGDQREPQIVWLKHTLVLLLGQLENEE